MNKKVESQKRIRQINIALTEAEYQMLQVIRMKHDKSVSELVRDSLLFYYANR
jgi:hypothetical protein